MFSYLYIGMSVVLFIKDSTGDKLSCHSENSENVKQGPLSCLDIRDMLRLEGISCFWSLQKRE